MADMSQSGLPPGLSNILFGAAPQATYVPGANAPGPYVVAGVEDDPLNFPGRYRAYAPSSWPTDTVYQYDTYQNSGSAPYSCLAVGGDFTLGTPPGGVSAPAAPAASIAAVAASSSSITLSLAAAGGVTPYAVTYQSSPSGLARWSTLATHAAVAGSDSYVASGLLAAAAYDFRALLTDAGSASATSPVATASTLAAGTPTPPPPASPTIPPAALAYAIAPRWLAVLCYTPPDPLAGIGSLAQAIAARYAARGFAAVAGPLWNNMPQPGSAPPMTVMKIAAGPTIYSSSTSRVADQRVTLRVRATDADASHAAAVAVNAEFEGASVAWKGGFAAPLTRTGWATDAETSLSEGPQVHYDELQYSARCRGPR